MKLRKNTPLMIAIIVINIAGSVVGLFYYWDQLVSASPFAWIFIPDCPLYTLLVAVVLAVYASTKRSSDLINFITAVGLAKYGTWTVIVVLGFSTFYFSVDSTLYTVLILMHVAMAAEFILPLLLIRQLKYRFTAIALVWFLANDFSDYFLGTHPPVPTSQISLIAAFTFLLTPLFIVLAYCTVRFLNNSKTHKDP
jgi:Predicted membrane protein